MSERTHHRPSGRPTRRRRDRRRRRRPPARGGRLDRARPEPDARPPRLGCPRYGRWGTYLSEREWGTPREAVDGNGWGLTWSEATSTDYRYSDDGIAGVTDVDNEFRLAWAFWEGTSPRVTERFNGRTNPGGPAGEEIIEDRVFGENGPTHAYSSLTYRYPSDMPWFSIELEGARLDSSTMTFVATVTNTTDETADAQRRLQGLARHPATRSSRLSDGLLLTGGASVVAVVGQKPSEWQISDKQGGTRCEPARRRPGRRRRRPQRRARLPAGDSRRDPPASSTSPSEG